MKTIQQMWTEFQKQVMNPKAPAIQVKEMRKSYFAGFFTMLLILRDFIGIAPEEDGVKYLDQLVKEMEEFVKNNGGHEELEKLVK